MAKPSSRAEALAAWFKAHARDLPWRRNPTAYRVWISEIMLQQTRVEAVREKYVAFLRRFPGLSALAQADEEAVLQAWSGLGYYRRARMLHAAAQKVVADHGGRFPRSMEEIRGLPGIGRYTAGAIASIAFNRPEPIVDGNVERVFARWHGMQGDIKGRKNQQRLWDLAQQWVEQGQAGGQHPRDLNQALMELGALVCTPRGPACGTCPVSAHCAAHKAGTPGAFPVRAEKSPRRGLRLWFAGLLDANGKVGLVRRVPGGPKSPLPLGLWELPHLPWPEGDQPAPSAELQRMLGVRLAPRGKALAVTHSIMDMNLTLVLQPFSLEGSPRFRHGFFRRFEPRHALVAAQSSATTKLLRELFA
ncbi:MAG: A/G-specific adenine glycosylase [Planctomycetes bacterium]|nr:A/G-specific adenine glycosylase [Planctomycetota bacterium]